MSDPAVKQRFYGWVMLPILCLVYSIPIGFALYGPPVIYQFMARDLHWQRGEINLGYTVIGMVLGISAPLTAWLLHRIGPRRTLTMGALLTAAASLLMAFFGYLYPLYLVLCLFVGLGIAFGSVLPIQTLVMYWFNARRAMAMGIVLGGGALGGFIYPQLVSAGIVAAGGDWRVGWNIIAAADFLGAIIALILVRNQPSDLGQHPDGLSPERLHELQQHPRKRLIRTYRAQHNWEVKDAVKTPTLWLLIVATGTVFFLWQVMLTQTPFHLRDRGFVSTDPLLFLRPEFIYGLIIFCSILGRLSVSFLGELVETRFMLSIAGFSLVIGGVLFWLASEEAMWAVYLYPLFVGFGFGATYVSSPLITGNYFGSGAFAGISGITNPIGVVFQFSSPFIAGLLYDINGNYGLAVLIACSAALVGSVLILFCTPPKLLPSSKTQA
jgi:MFS family permease